MKALLVLLLVVSFNAFALEDRCRTADNIRCLWLPGFAPEAKLDAPHNTAIDLRVGYINVYRIPACVNVAGRIQISEVRGTKMFALTDKPGAVQTNDNRCGLNQPAPSGEVRFNFSGSGNNCLVPTGEMSYFSIRCASGPKCSYFFRVDNYLSRPDCSVPELGPEPEPDIIEVPASEIELRFTDLFGKVEMNEKTKRPCKHYITLGLQNPNTEIPIYMATRTEKRPDC